eukprot:6435643-Amphidinium_carterae.1
MKRPKVAEVLAAMYAEGLQECCLKFTCLKSEASVIAKGIVPEKLFLAERLLCLKWRCAACIYREALLAILLSWQPRLFSEASDHLSCLLYVWGVLLSLHLEAFYVLGKSMYVRVGTALTTSIVLCGRKKCWLVYESMSSVFAWK